MPFPICVHRFDSSQRNEKNKGRGKPKFTLEGGDRKCDFRWNKMRRGIDGTKPNYLSMIYSRNQILAFRLYYCCCIYCKDYNLQKEKVLI